MSLRRPVLALLTVTALALSGCSGDPSPAGESEAPAADTSALVVDGVVDDAVAEALVEEARSLDDAELERRAAEASRELELELYAVSGLTEELGGEEAAAASIEETAEWMAGLAAEAAAYDGGPAARVAPFGVGRRSSQATTFGEGLFGALLLGSLFGDLAASIVSRARGETDSQDKDGVRISIEGGTEATITTTHTLTDKNGVRTDLTSKTTMSGCPDADGTFRASTLVEFGSTVAGGRTGKRGSIRVEVVGTVGDSAQLLGYDTVYQGEMADFVNSRGGYAQITGTIPREGKGNLAVTRTGGAYTDAIGTQATVMGYLGAALIADRLAKGAQKVWESGACVVLEPTVSDGPTGLDPGQTVEIIADPKARKDGRPTGGVVTAVLSSGAASVTPGESPARATFTYTAPPGRDERGTVSLVSRSRRGIGKAEITFDTKVTSYVASGGGEVAFSGKVPSVEQPFSITGTFPGGTTTFTFDAQGSRAGRVKVTGGGSGASLTGSGTYTISEKSGGVLLLTAKVRSCVNVSKVCRSTTHPITLTPEK